MRFYRLFIFGIVLVAICLIASIGVISIIPFPILFLILFLIIFRIIRAVKKNQNGRNTEQNNTEQRNEEFRAEEPRTEEFRSGETHYTGSVIICDYCGSSVDTSKYSCCNHCGAPYGDDTEWKEIHYNRNR